MARKRVNFTCKCEECKEEIKFRNEVDEETFAVLCPKCDCLTPIYYEESSKSFLNLDEYVFTDSFKE